MSAELELRRVQRDARLLAIQVLALHLIYNRERPLRNEELIAHYVDSPPVRERPLGATRGSDMSEVTQLFLDDDGQTMTWESLTDMVEAISGACHPEKASTILRNLGQEMIGLANTYDEADDEYGDET